MIKLFFEAFHSKGFLGYSSEKAQEKFAESLLKIADKMFWAPMAYLGLLLYQSKELAISDFVYVVLFIVFGVMLRHEALRVYDLHANKAKQKLRNRHLKNNA